MNDIDEIARSRASELWTEAMRIADTDRQLQRLLDSVEPGVRVLDHQHSGSVPGRRMRIIALATAASIAVVAITVGLLRRDNPMPTIVPATVVNAPDQTDSTAPSGSVATTDATTDATTGTTPDTTRATDPTKPTSVVITEVATDPAATALRDWLTAQLAAGLSQTTITAGDGTPARLVLSRRIGSTGFSAAVVLGDGRIVEMPADAPNPGVTVASLNALGDQLVVFERNGQQFTGWVLDPSTLTWSAAPDLGLGPIPNQSAPHIATVGDSIVVTSVSFASQSPDPDRQVGAVLSPDLQVTPMAQPPIGVVMDWNVVAAGNSMVLTGQDTSATDQTPVRHPWAYDAVSNVWTSIPNPSWTDCGLADDQCVWGAPHEYGDPYLVADTPTGVVIRVPDGSIGVLDVATATWRRLDDPPISLGNTTTALLGDGSLVAFPRTYREGSDVFGDLAILDVALGTWTALHLDVAATTSMYSVRWDVRSGDDTILISTVDETNITSVSPQFAIDRATGEPRGVTPDDSLVWRQLYAGDGSTADTLAATAP